MTAKKNHGTDARLASVAIRQQQRDNLIMLGLFVLLFLFGIFVGFATGRATPRYVGHNCVHTGDIYANDPADLFMCEEVEVRSVFGD